MANPIIESSFVFNSGGTPTVTMNDLTTDPSKVYRLTDVKGLGMPEVRITQEYIPEDQGIEDLESFYGKRTIVLTGAIEADTETKLEQLKEDLQNAIDPVEQDYKYLSWTDPHKGSIRVNAKAIKMQIKETAEEGYTREFKITFNCKDPRVEAATGSSATGTPASSAGAGLPWTLPVELGGSTGSATPSGTNDGNFPAYPTIKVYGICTGPRIENSTTGKYLDFTGDVSLGSGDYLEIDVKNGTCTKVSGGTSTNVYQYLIDGSEFWTVEPGVNSFSLTANSSGSGFSVDINFYNTWI